MNLFQKIFSLLIDPDGSYGSYMNSQSMLIHRTPSDAFQQFIKSEWRDEQNYLVLEERSFWPRHIKSSKDKITEYWIENHIYTQMQLAQDESKKYGFNFQTRAHTGNNPEWIPIFKDFDKALAFLKDKTHITYIYKK